MNKISLFCTILLLGINLLSACTYRTPSAPTGGSSEGTIVGSVGGNR